MAYRWEITRDHIEIDGPVTIRGPREYDRSITDSPSSFELFDDDGVLQYSGVIFGNYTGFEPLDDFGTPNAGCTLVKLNGESL